MFEKLSLRLGARENSETVPLGVESAGTPAAHISAEARQAVENDVAVSTRKRGRPRGAARDSGGDSGDVQAKVNQAVIAQLDALHDPKAWEALLCIPADGALTITGNKIWNLEERERQTLGITGSAAARTMMITNPRSLAFFMLGSALFSVYAPRAIKQIREMREEAAKKTKAKTPDETKPAA